MDILLKKKLKGRKILQDNGLCQMWERPYKLGQSKRYSILLSGYSIGTYLVLTLCHQVLVLRHYFKQGTGELRAEGLTERTCRHGGPGEMELISAKGSREGSDWQSAWCAQ